MRAKLEWQGTQRGRWAPPLETRSRSRDSFSRLRGKVAREACGNGGAPHGAPAAPPRSVAFGDTFPRKREKGPD